MKLAIIPWADEFKKDKMFDIEDKVINRDHLMEPYYEMQQYFMERGDELHTIDVYKDLKEIDYYLFFDYDWEIIYRLVKMGRADRMVYCNAEPPVVNKNNTLEGYKKRSIVFPYFMTWNDEWVDNVSIFKKNIPYHFEDDRNGMKPFNERKLITFISGFKSSSHPDELYSERERAISYYEKNHPEDFDFYGAGWIKEDHPCYRGKAVNKAEVYHGYKFAICYENMKNVSGYITEKILDCITAGIVPVYMGANNIADVVPDKCFISREDFADYETLHSFLVNMSESDYQKYLDSADLFLKSDKKQLFEGSEYARCIYKVIESGNDKKKFRISLSGRYYVFKTLMKVRRRRKGKR